MLSIVRLSQYSYENESGHFFFIELESGFLLHQFADTL